VRFINLFLLFFAFLPFSALAGEVIIPFESVGADIVDNGSGQVTLEAPGFSTDGPPGNPTLPNIGTYVLLPQNADISTLRVEIRNAVEEKVEGVFDILPVPPAGTYIDGQMIEDWGIDGNIVDGKNTLVYEKNEFYPQNYASLGYDSKLGKYQLVAIEFWPYRYNPVNGELMHLVRGDVAIIFDTAMTIQNAGMHPDMTDRLSELAINWQQAAEWYSSPQPFTVTASTPLAIITTSAIVNSSNKLADFVAHKARMGFDVTGVTESQWGGGTGDTAAENLRTWLKNNYATKARYAILIGNPHPSNGTVPMKMLYPRSNQTDYKEAPSDYYYADLTGNWDLDGDGQYGEAVGDFGTGGVDRVAEVMIGRIPYYGSIPDLDSILQKIINYETAASIGDWADRMLLPMKPLDDSTPNWHLGEQIRSNVAIPAELNTYRIYDENYSINPAPEKTPCSTTNVRNEWAKGYGYVVWSTHGSPTSASSVFWSSYCSMLDNNKPAFTFQSSCENGQPEATNNLGYSLLRHGAIATVSASRVSWYTPGQTNFTNSNASNGMAYRYIMRLAKERQRCGDALYNMKASFSGSPPYMWANFVVFNLYGDPTIIPRRSTQIDITNESVPNGRVGKAYSVTLSAIGGVAPYTWTIESGSLPPGLTLSSNGVISGTPTSPGLYVFTVQVNGGPDGLGTKQFSVMIDFPAYIYDFNTIPDWTLEGDWAIGKPTGEGSYNCDPTSGYTGSNVLGYNLNGDYTNSMPATYATTHALDCSSMVGTTLSFWRWLGIDTSLNDKASIQISTDNINWTTVWSNPINVTLDTEWNFVSYDISSYADGQPTVYIRWGMGPTNTTITCPGWNIDDVEIASSTLSRPFIRHTTHPNTDVTVGSYPITATIITGNGRMLSGNPILWWRANGGDFNSVDMTLNGNVYTANIPAQPGGTVISYYIEASDSAGTAYSPSLAPDAYHTFTIILDTIPPVIQHTPLPNTSETGPYKVTATVTDNWGVSTVTLTRSKNNGTPVTVLMSKSTDPATPNEYYAYIPGPVTVGDWYSYKITAIDKYNLKMQSTSPASGWYTFSIVPPKTLVYSFPLNSDPGWTCDSGWEFGTPTGEGSINRDPTSGYTGSFVYGYNLSGDYQNNMTTTSYLTTNAIDCSYVGNVTLKFRRWLGIEGSKRDKATIEVSNDGVNWTTVWSNPTTIISDIQWNLQTYDISSVADYQPTVYIRWGIGPTDNSFTMSGWNIDDIEIWGDVFEPAESVYGLKCQKTGENLFITNAVVSAVYQNYFYLQDKDGYQGIRVFWPGPVAEGYSVSTHGVLKVRNGELELVASGVSQGDYAGPVRPVFMTSKTLGGSSLGLQGATWGIIGIQLTENYGLNNTGTLVTICGKVTQKGSDYFYVDDGCGIWDGTYTNSDRNIGVRIQWPGTDYNIGQFVTVTGISSGFMNGSYFMRVILPRRAEDIR